MTKRSYKSSSSRTKNPLDLIHSDVCGPMSVNSIGDSRYFVVFVDDFTRYVTVYTLKRKSQVLSAFKRFKESAENIGAEFVSFCESNGIKRELTVPHHPQQNGTAERYNRTLNHSGLRPCSMRHT